MYVGVYIHIYFFLIKYWAYDGYGKHETLEPLPFPMFRSYVMTFASENMASVVYATAFFFSSSQLLFHLPPQ